MATVQGDAEGKTIALDQEPIAPDVQPGAALASSLDPHPAWLERFVVDASVMPGKFVIRGTRLLVDDLVQLAVGRTDDRLRQLHPELTTADLEAVRNYALVPEGSRRSFGGWVEDVEALDNYLEWTRRQRKVLRPELAD
jgi:uncharacterized protein (DUF433 family)